jgi:hypothetical protein
LVMWQLNFLWENINLKKTYTSFKTMNQSGTTDKCTELILTRGQVDLLLTMPNKHVICWRTTNTLGVGSILKDDLTDT